MNRKAAFRQSDVARLVAGAIKGGLPVGSFKIGVEKGQPVILPISNADPLPSDQESGEAEWDEALGLQ